MNISTAKIAAERLTQKRKTEVVVYYTNMKLYIINLTESTDVVY